MERIPARPNQKEGTRSTLQHLECEGNDLPPAALSAKKAAQFLGIELASINYLVRARKIPVVRLGEQRGLVFLVEDLRDLLLKCREPSADELEKKRNKRREG